MSQRDEIDQLEQLLNGTLDPDDAPDELARLGSLATALRDTVEVERPTPTTKAALRAELLETIQAERVTWWTRLRERVDAATARWRYSARTAIATATASMMIGTAGVAAAAQAALPGDLLYDIKLWTEDARLAFADGDAAQGRLHLLFAQQRLEEVGDGLDRLTDDELSATFARMDEESAAGAELLLGAAVEAPGEAAEVLLGELEGFTEVQGARIAGLIDTLPLAVVPAAEDSLEVLRRIDLQVSSLLAPATACGECGIADPTSIGAGRPVIVLPGDGPAAPPLGCECVDATATPLPREDTDETSTSDTGDTAGEPTPTDEPATAPTDASSGGNDDRLVVPELPGPLDDAGTVVDDLIGDIVGDTPLEDPVDDVGDTVDDVVDGATGDGVVEDVTETVDDVTDPLTSEDGGLVDGLLGD